jgi:hypothetical protein
MDIQFPTLLPRLQIVIKRAIVMPACFAVFFGCQSTQSVAPDRSLRLTTLSDKVFDNFIYSGDPRSALDEWAAGSGLSAKIIPRLVVVFPPQPISMENIEINVRSIPAFELLSLIVNLAGWSSEIRVDDPNGKSGEVNILAIIIYSWFRELGEA